MTRIREEDCVVGIISQIKQFKFAAKFTSDRPLQNGRGGMQTARQKHR